MRWGILCRDTSQGFPRHDNDTRPDLLRNQHKPSLPKEFVQHYRSRIPSLKGLFIGGQSSLPSTLQVFNFGCLMKTRCRIPWLTCKSACVTRFAPQGSAPPTTLVSAPSLCNSPENHCTVLNCKSCTSVLNFSGCLQTKDYLHCNLIRHHIFRDRRSRKFFVNWVNFSANYADYEQNLHQ